MTRVYLLRHTQYESPNHILPFRLPGFRLSEEGVFAAKALAEEFIKKEITAIYCSPLERTQETAQIIGNVLGLTPMTDERLLEMRSPVQGKTEAFLDHLGGWKVYTTDWYKKENGETPEEATARMDEFMKEKVREHAGKNIIVVSHGDPIMLYHALYAKKPVVSLPYIHMGEYLTLAYPQSSAIIVQ